MTEEIPIRHDIGGKGRTTKTPSTGKTGSRSARSHRSTRHMLPIDITREEATRRMELLYHLARLIADSNYDTGRMAQAVADMLSEMIGDLSVITLLNADHQSYQIAAYADPDARVMALFEQVIQQVGNIPRRRAGVPG